MPNNEEVEKKFMPSTIETIDTAMYKYIEETLNLHAQTNRGFKKVPVIWVGAERTYQLKHDLTLRDKEGLLLLPLMTIERKGITKDPSKSPIPGNIPDMGDGGVVPISRTINQQKTAIFKANQNAKKSGADGNVGFSDQYYPFPRKAGQGNIASMFDTRPVNMKEKVVYETTYIPIPVYINVKYEISIRTEYQQQMNQLMTPFLAAHSRAGRNHKYFIMRQDNHSFEAFMDGNFSSSDNVATLNEEERIFNTLISIDVLGYLIGGDVNEHSNLARKYENIVDVKVSRERVILDEQPPRQNISGSNPFYKE